MRLCWLVCLAILLWACTALTQPVISLPTATPAPIPTLADQYAVTAWVNDPEPDPDQNVILSGNLNKNGVILSGIMMEGIWQQPGEEKPSLHCSSLINYQRGRCNIASKDFPLDTYVPLTIHIHYAGMTFIAETGFTPRNK
ncbi:MAG TPA: hypothetical protein VN363_10415 [Anaerolineales bacterium]|nr:hypothetical protein [Anaerolineales bacterium]